MKTYRVQGSYINYSVPADVVLNTKYAKIAAVSRKADILLCPSSVIDNASFFAYRSFNQCKLKISS